MTNSAFGWILAFGLDVIEAPATAAAMSHLRKSSPMYTMKSIIGCECPVSARKKVDLPVPVGRARTGYRCRIHPLASLHHLHHSPQFHRHPQGCLWNTRLMVIRAITRSRSIGKGNSSSYEFTVSTPPSHSGVSFDVISLPKQTKRLSEISYPRHPKWMFPRIGVPQNGWFIMENPFLKWMIWGVFPYFWKHPNTS